MRFTKTNAPANGRAASWRMPRAGPANGPMPRCNARGPESAAPRGPQPPAVRAALSEPALQAATPRRTVKGLPGLPRRRPSKDTEPPPATRAQSRPPLSSPHKREGGRAPPHVGRRSANATTAVQHGRRMVRTTPNRRHPPVILRSVPPPNPTRSSRLRLRPKCPGEKRTAPPARPAFRTGRVFGGSRPARPNKFAFARLIPIPDCVSDTGG